MKELCTRRRIKNRKVEKVAEVIGLSCGFSPYLPLFDFFDFVVKYSRLSFVAFVVNFLLLGNTVFAAELDLDSYLKMVEQNNPDLTLALKEIEAAKQTSAQARSALLPGIVAQGDYKRNFFDQNQPTPVAADATGGPPVMPLIYQDMDANLDNEITLAVGASQTIFDAEAVSNIRLAKKGEALQGQIYQAALANLRGAAKKLYAQGQLAQRVVEIRRTSENTSREIYQSIERKFQAGMATELDLLMSEVDWKNCVRQTAEALRNAEIVLMELKKLAGIPLRETLVLTGNDNEINTAIGSPAVPDIPALQTVLIRRADYRALLLSREMADIQKDAALSSFLPTVSASFSYAWGSMGNGGSLHDSGADFKDMQLGLSVTIPLFVGGYRLARVKSAAIEQEKASIALSKKQTDIESELLQLELRIKDAWNSIESVKLTVTAANRAVELSRSSYANGLVTQLQVSEAVNRADEANLALQYAIFEYRSACIDYELAAGL
jgi:outer membrane protein TolC